MAKIVMLPQRTPRTAVAWFKSVHDVMQPRYLEDDPLEAKTLNKLHSVAAVLCIYADKDLRIQRTSKHFLARRVGLQETDFAAACRDLGQDGDALPYPPPRQESRFVRAAPPRATAPVSAHRLTVPLSLGRNRGAARQSSASRSTAALAS